MTVKDGVQVLRGELGFDVCRNTQGFEIGGYQGRMFLATL